MATGEQKPSSLKRTIKAPALSATFLVLLLSLATWYFFYMRSMPLTPGDIAVVAIFWVVMVVAGKWLVGRLRRSRKKAASAKKKADVFQLSFRACRLGGQCSSFPE